MKKVLMITMFVLSAYGLSGQVVLSDKTGWHKIGEKTVNFSTDRDEISVVVADKFSAIKFKVKDEPIHLMELDAYFDDGGKQNINVNFPLKPQGESRVIDLKGGERDLKKVVFVYKTVANRNDRKAEVELWGLKTNADKK